jgi:dipeptidyl aminopeptidase/acylaminoacyl peptidase
MKRDLRATESYREIERRCEALKRCGSGQLSDAADLHSSPDGNQAVFAGVMFQDLEGSPPTRICHVDLGSGTHRVLTFGPNSDRSPRYSPDGSSIAFLSDRRAAGDFQLYLLNPLTGASRPTVRVDGWVEYLKWSPDGDFILLGVAGHGADIAGGLGAITSKHVDQGLPTWVPSIDSGEASYRWRRVWIYDVRANAARQIASAGINIWEAAWRGPASLVAVTSSGPGEGHWYSARISLIDVRTQEVHEIYRPRDQVGCVAGSPSGRHVAFVEAVCSDRGIVAGSLRMYESDTGRTREVDTHAVDITHAEWRSDHRLLVCGHRGFDTVIGLYDVAAGQFQELWVNQEITGAGRYVSVAGLNSVGDCALVGETYLRAPEIAVIARGHYRSVLSFDPGCDPLRASVEQVSWKAPDGLEIFGYVLTPRRKGPHPLLMNIHGGPVWHWRPSWAGRGPALIFALLQRGYAVFYPNPRGSGGRGQDFARSVVGDMGGVETHDFLSGVEYLVAQGIAEAGQLGVSGISYGGFMTSWLITQDQRFAAAIPVSAATNYVSAHLISNIPSFYAMFLGDTLTHAGGKYMQRSPVLHAGNARTPTLNICGALDRCTPPEESVQFHNALLESGVTSALITYPEEGHGIRKFPAAIDYAARVVNWLEQFMPATGRGA